MSRRSHGRPSRATLKRNIPSFTVEVRRQPRRASNPSANGRLFETAPIRTAFDRDTQRAADAVFEAKAPEQPLPDSAPSAPKGRILPSLVVDDASMRSFREDPEQLDEFARGPPKRRSARFQKTAKPSKPRRISASPSAETAPLAPPAEAIDVPPSEPPAASRRSRRKRRRRRVAQSAEAAGQEAEGPRIRSNRGLARPAGTHDHRAQSAGSAFSRRRSFAEYSQANHHGPLRPWRRTQARRALEAAAAQDALTRLESTFRSTSSLRAQRSNPGAASRSPWVASSLRSSQ